MNRGQQPAATRRPSEQDFEAVWRKALGTPDPDDIYAHSEWEITEDQLLTEIIRLCGVRGILCFHIDRPYRSRRRGVAIAGFPDLLLVGTHGVAWRELKRQWLPKFTPAQITWRNMLRASGQDWELWRPADLLSGRIDRELDALCGRPASPRKFLGKLPGRPHLPGP